MKIFWRLLVVVVAKQCECTWYHWPVYLKSVKMVNVLLHYIVYHNKQTSFLKKSRAPPSKTIWYTELIILLYRKGTNIGLDTLIKIKTLK